MLLNESWPVTGVGTSRLTWVPSPSAPTSLSPQQWA